MLTGYPNVGLHFKPIELANVESIPTTININYTYEYEPTATANVAYDLFTSSTPDGEFEYEIMVWLAAIGTAWPLSSEGKNIKNTTVSGVDFMLNHGVNGNMTVFSYVASKLTQDFSGDLTEFIDNLPEDVAPDAKQYLTKVQCGCGVAGSANLRDCWIRLTNSAQTPTNGGGPPMIRVLLNFPHLVYPSVGRDLALAVTSEEFKW
ncbi:Glycosyl hydrolase family 12 [Phytophthora infestans]|uniref:Glycosyl hydrolase family 12 n=1 Tax=Phytophthora infestans TaxID=4787 RepID=A0A8S9UE44_PHYIN|nr:Glycosyl hydrolase family 12 [Phytophthora infestans]